MPADVLSQLLETSWRGISFPTVAVNAKGGHNVVAHRRMDRDGWRVENTGRNSYAFSFKIPFINTLARGPGETWRDLFPDTYLRVLAALEDRSTGPLVHPSYGQRLCKVVDWEETLDPDFRGGPVLQVQWWETVDEGDAITVGETAVVPIAAQAAVNLDAKIATLTPPPDTGLDQGETLADFIRGVTTAVDRVDLASKQFEAKIARVIYRIDALRDRLGAFADDPGYGEDADRLISALHATQRQLGTLAKSTKVYVVPKATTLPALATRLGARLSDLANLNPALLAAPIVPSTTVVRYYA